MWSLAARRGVLRPDDELFGLDPAGLHDLARARTAGWHPQLHGLVEHGDDFQAAQQIGGAVGFGKAGVAVGQRDLGHVAGDIQDTGPAEG